MNPLSNKAQHNFFLFLFIGAAIVMFFIFTPFINSLVMAAALAIVFYPFYRKLAKKMNLGPNVASLVTVLFILLLVLVPLIVIGGFLFDEVKNVYVSVADSNNMGITHLISSVEGRLRIVSPDINLDAARYVQAGLQWIISHLDSFFSGFLSVVLNIFIMIIALFFMLRDGTVLRDKLYMLSPLEQKYDETIFAKLVLAVNSVIKGSLVIAIIQGLFAAFGFWATGVPNPLLWGVAAMLASLIPGIGTSLITIPVIVYLLITQPLWHGIVLAAWAAFGIGLIDNFTAPYVLKRGIKIHPFLILISVLGGISYFGPIGFIIGPVVLAFFFALLDIYPLIIREHPNA